MKLRPEFYVRSNVVKIARDLIGKVLISNKEGVLTGGVIVETEAYSWKERGCHAYGGKITQRNRVMFEQGGLAYVYLCYGMHNLFNVVTNRQGVADAVLVRALEPVEGVTTMAERRRVEEGSVHLTSGPGKLTHALGIDRSLNGKLLWDSEVWIEENGVPINGRLIKASKRIGIEYAGSDAALPWRFSLKGNKWVSR